jgi:hypothetical protein
VNQLENDEREPETELTEAEPEPADADPELDPATRFCVMFFVSEGFRRPATGLDSPEVWRESPVLTAF